MRFVSSSLAVLALTTALAVAAPVANAQLLPGGGAVLGPCGDISSAPDSGLSGVQYDNCSGAALVFNGPAIGRIGVIIGPTIMSPGFVGPVAVSGGSVFMGPGAGSVVGVP
jgi:hypothetical protein